MQLFIVLDLNKILRLVAAFLNPGSGFLFKMEIFLQRVLTNL